MKTKRPDIDAKLIEDTKAATGLAGVPDKFICEKALKELKEKGLLK